MGNMVSAVIGIGVRYAVPDQLMWLRQALAVSLSILAMLSGNCLHPPGGATALLAASAREGDVIFELGWMFLIFPVLFGYGFMLLVALFFINIFEGSKYPVKWIN